MDPAADVEGSPGEGAEARGCVRTCSIMRLQRPWIQAWESRLQQLLRQVPTEEGADDDVRTAKVRIRDHVAARWCQLKKWGHERGLREISEQAASAC